MYKHVYSCRAGVKNRDQIRSWNTTLKKLPCLMTYNTWHGIYCVICVEQAIAWVMPKRDSSLAFMYRFTHVDCHLPCVAMSSRGTFACAAAVAPPDLNECRPDKFGNFTKCFNACLSFFSMAACVTFNCKFLVSALTKVDALAPAPAKSDKIAVAVLTGHKQMLFGFFDK